MMNWTLGTDTSHWSGLINFQTMYDAGAKWWITKATDANRTTGYQFEDSRFDGYMRDAEKTPLLKGCYHWLQYSVDPVVAADFYLERYNRFKMDFPPVLDFEEPSVRNTGRFSDYAWRAQEWCKRVEDVTGRQPIIYTARWFTNYFTDKMIGWMSDYPLWVASYPWVWTSLSKPVMPSVWDKWTMWQYSADSNNRGKEFGLTGGSIDLNWYKGTYEELLAWLDASAPEPEEEEMLFKAKCVTPALNVRSGPSIAYGIVGLLREGDEVNVYEVADNGWFRIGGGRWVSGHEKYMERLIDPEPAPLTLEERVADNTRRIEALEAK